MRSSPRTGRCSRVAASLGASLGNVFARTPTHETSVKSAMGYGLCSTLPAAVARIAPRAACRPPDGLSARLRVPSASPRIRIAPSSLHTTHHCAHAHTLPGVTRDLCLASHSLADSIRKSDALYWSSPPSDAASSSLAPLSYSLSSSSSSTSISCSRTSRRRISSIIKS